MPTNIAFIKMLEAIIKRQNIQLLKAIAKNEDLDYETLVKKYVNS